MQHKHTEEAMNAQNPHVMVAIHTLRDKKDRLVPFHRLATRHSWNGLGVRRDGSPYYRADWVTLFAKNPESMEQAAQWSDAHCLWFVLDGGKFMTPCLIREDRKTPPRNTLQNATEGPETPQIDEINPSHDSTPAIDSSATNKAVSGPSEQSAGVDLWDFL